jgi:hypothetical protein
MIVLIKFLFLLVFLNDPFLVLLLICNRFFSLFLFGFKKVHYKRTVQFSEFLRALSAIDLDAESKHMTDIYRILNFYVKINMHLPIFYLKLTTVF